MGVTNTSKKDMLRSGKASAPSCMAPTAEPDQDRNATEEVDPESQLPAWVLVALGFTGLVGYNISATLVPRTDQLIFHRDETKIEWGKYVSLPRCLGCAAGCFYTILCFRMNWGLRLPWFMATHGQALAYFLICVVFVVAEFGVLSKV
ncbi:unnamed protein product, partial [Amoebophrya sp. A25]|eukprot:GSA25T00024221001.1